LVARCPVSQILCPDGGIPAQARLNVAVMHDPDVGADVAFMAEKIDQSRYINTINEPMEPAFIETN
jgi:hypothetical protein